MASYGRNFDFRVPPYGASRKGRFFAPLTGARIPIGAPIGATTGAVSTDLQLAPINLTTSATTPVSGKHGILVYEYAPAAFAGDDPFIVTYSDKDTAPLGAAVQLVSGKDVKVVFKNTSARTFLRQRAYAARTMVAGIGIATPTIAVGDFLTPGVGNDSAGYWAEVGAGATAWLVVTGIDNARAEVEAQLLF